jgi:UDP-N-acetylglucosamine--N-acetylmuramyl-(pentapeptide) pyrophosphoryl-undecaprenol N-acetylglucosamine transferase
MLKKIRIIITGGGTAGHVMPALAVIEALKEKECQILYIGSKKEVESDLIKNYKIEFNAIATGKLRRYWSLKNLIDPLKAFIGLCQSLLIILRFEPDVVFSKGGYVSLPVVLASWLVRKPIILHESDVVLGLANRFSLRFACRLAVSFPVECYPSAPAKKIIYTGTPLRKNVFEGNKERGKTFFQLRDDLPVLLITGGSQGARKINEKALEILTELLSKMQIIHITGFLDFKKFKSFKEELPQDLKENYKVYTFLKNELGDAISCADLVISRGGANMIFEIATQKKPAILIPLEGHQEENTSFFARHKAAYVIANKDLTSEKLLQAVNYLLENPEMSQKMANSANVFVVPDAAKILAGEIIKLAK